MQEEVKLYQIDAFADQIFKGNSAAVMPLDEWLPEKILQQLAMENNLSETAFFVAENNDYRIRWFTPTHEVKLCGHATLAAAHVLFQHLKYERSEINFHSLSGLLSVVKNKQGYCLDFPTCTWQEIAEIPEFLQQGLGIDHEMEIYQAGEDLLVVLPHEQAVQQLAPDFELLRRIVTRGIIVTATGKQVDFVSRFFAPKYGINEDPVTGSAHCVLTPFWADRLDKKKLTARQISVRGGTLYCDNQGNRVAITGKAVTYLIGTVYTLRE